MAENLWAISIDPDESMREYVLLQLKVRAMRDLLFRSKIFTYLAAATPGLRELVTIGKIWELAQDDRKVKKGRNYDLVIVDAPATGHGVGFLQTPRTFANVARVGPIASQAETLDRFLTDQRRTGVAIVALPEEMPVNETATLERDLTSEVGVAVDRIFCNGLYPERFSEDDEQRDRGGVRGCRGRRAPRAAGRPLRAPPRRRPARAARPARGAHRGAASRRCRSCSSPSSGPSTCGSWPQRFEGLMASVGDLLEGKRVCICAGSGGVGKTTTSAAIAAGMAARGQEGRRADHRPGEAARRLARACRSSATRSAGSTPACSPRPAWIRATVSSGR